MILDKGICTIYTVSNIATAGNMPKQGLVKKYESWYGELSFETAPVNAEEGQESIEVSARIRVVQNRAIQNHDVAIFGGVQYDVTRAYHGIDKENGQPISDLTLLRVVNVYDIA